MWFGCSKEPSHRDSSSEYPQHMFWLRNKIIIASYAFLSGGYNIIEYSTISCISSAAFPEYSAKSVSNDVKP